jgi:hypothetical protein
MTRIKEQPRVLSGENQKKYDNPESMFRCRVWDLIPGPKQHEGVVALLTIVLLIGFLNVTWNTWRRICCKPQNVEFQVSVCKLNGFICKSVSFINHLNAELNPICHLLILLGDLTFMGPCIISIFQYISNKMQRYAVNLHLETAVRVSSGTSTHHQEPPTAHSNRFQLFHDSGR